MRHALQEGTDKDLWPHERSPAHSFQSRQSRLRPASGLAGPPLRGPGPYVLMSYTYRARGSHGCHSALTWGPALKGEEERTWRT